MSRLCVVLVGSFVIWSAINIVWTEPSAASRETTAASKGPLGARLASDLDGLLMRLGSGAAGFSIPTTLLLGGPPESSVAVGDFNGDGHHDLAVSKAGSDEVWILHGDGSGRFGTPTRLAANTRQKVVATGDFNHDGIDDQAVAEQFSAGVSVLFGDGSGGFRPANDASGTSKPATILVGDFDRDGIVDVAVVDGVSGHVVILLGDRRGGFKSETRISVGSAPTFIAVGDFNGDGIADLAVTSNGSDSVSILLGDDRGGFNAATSFAAGPGPTSVAVGDFNGDGVADLAVVGSLSDGLSILLGDGQGGFAAPVRIALDGGVRTDSLAVTTSSVGTSSYVGFPVVSVTLSPATIAGGSGGTTTGTVTLGGPAPAGGTPINVTSSNTELAASVLSIVVPQGATSVTFTVATNARYRRYSRLAFTATITASNPGDSSSGSATLTVTAQPLPTDVVLNPDTDLTGLACAGETGILFDCKKGPNSFTQGTCAFKQECTLGCLTRPIQGAKWNDTCALIGPFPIVLSPRIVAGGNNTSGTLLLTAPAAAGSTAAVTSSSLVASSAVGLPQTIPTGATRVGFDVQTAAVNAVQFAEVDGHIRTIESGSSVFTTRNARTWAAVVPGNAPPIALTSLGLDRPTTTGGLAVFGTVTINQLAPTPAIGTVTVSVTSSNPAVASILQPSLSFVQGSSNASFAIQTSAVALDTAVTISATLGATTLTRQLTVTATPGATSVTSLFLDPLQVTGGNSVTGTVVLNGLAPSGGAVVRVASGNSAVVIPPATVTVPAGTDMVSFSVGTAAVAASTTVLITATFGSGSAFTSLIVLPAATPLTLASLALSPTSVVGGNPSTGTATLSAAVPAGSAGAVVTLSTSNSAVASVPASVTVPAGAISTTFTATTTVVAASTSANITATFGGVSRTTTLAVTPAAAPAPTLSSLTLNPTSVVGGSTNSQGMVTLSAAAPAGGVVITLSSSNAAVATVPASLTVPAGSSSATFTVTTQPVTASTSATISATSGVTKTALLTVTPPTPPPMADTVAITRAEYIVADRILNVEATSTSTTATLQAFVTSTGALIGTLINKGGGKYQGQLPWPVNPVNTTVKSSGGGAATSGVPAK